MKTEDPTTNDQSPEGTDEVHIETINDAHRVSVLFESLLKRPLSLVEHIRKEQQPWHMNLAFLMITVVSLIVYGFVVGSFAMHEQLWASPLKFLLGAGMSALICFPSLYIFSCLTGAGCELRSLVPALLGTLALLGVLLVGFSPVLWVFSQSTHLLGFMGFLILVSWVIAFVFAMGFLDKLMKRSGARKLHAIKVWSGIFLLVTLQMSSSLRPILGRSDQLLTNEKRFFIQHWVETAGEVIGESH